MRNRRRRGLEPGRHGEQRRGVLSDSTAGPEAEMAAGGIAPRADRSPNALGDELAERAGVGGRAVARSRQQKRSGRGRQDSGLQKARGSETGMDHAPDE